MRKIVALAFAVSLSAGSLLAQTITDSVLYINEGTTEIAYKAYYGRTDFNKVVIPSSVTVINGLAFHNCTKLKEIEIPASVDSIGNAVFQNDSSLTKVTLHEGLTNLSYRLFKSCVSLTEITIPSTITKFGDYSLSECDNLTTIKVDRYTEAHTYFCKDSRLAFTDNPPKQSREQWLATATRDIIEDSVLYIKPGTTVIKGDAYIYAKAFTKVVIPNTVTEIGKQAFFGTNVREVTIPGSVQIIKNSAFYCSHLEKAILEEGVKEIDSYAFNTYRKLYIYVPNSVDTLAANNGVTNGEAVWTVVQGSYAEEYVKSRCSYNIDYTQPYSAYSGETALKVSINGNVSTDYFKNCPNLQSVDIGPGVTEIVSGTFADNLTLRAKRNTFADTWAKANGYYLCSVLADLNVYTKDASKKIEEDFTRILCDDDSYANWTSYKYVIQQPLKLEEVDNKLVLTSFMLYPCENVTVTDKNGKILISNKTIQPLTRTVLCDFDFLTDSVENFTITTDDAFYKRLVSIPTEWSISYDGRIYRPEKYKNDLIRPMRPVFAREYIAGIYNVAYIAGSPEYAARCYQAVEEKTLVTNEELTEFLTKEQMDNLLKKASKWSIMLGRCEGGLSVAGGQAIWLDNTWLLGLSCGTGNSFWHEHSHNMGWGHEDGNMCNDGRPAPYNLDWPGIGNLVYKEEFKKGTPPYLEGKLFFNSNIFSYDELYLPDIPDDVVIDSILYITEGIPLADSHKEQTDFTKVVIPSSVEVVTNSAFYGTKIENVEIPSSVTIIKKLAFHSCEELKTITIPSSVKEIGDAAFQNCTSLTSVEIPNSLRELNTKLFKSSGLTEITIPANIKLIGKEAFADCKDLKTVVIEDGVRKIDNNAFYNTGIDTIVIPESVTMIGKNITSKNVVWVVEKDSYAHTYAIENNLTFKIKNSEGEDAETAVTEQITNTNIYTVGKNIVVENATDDIFVYDAMGRLVGRDVARNVSTITVNDSGVYIVKIGGLAKKIFVE
ncbi:MAG: leucine-rich repeat domain-containing protein [Salinivirgaceae bacterium]|nr:leucine-rich repeat domain-containing protein [Salinivirgaceae bacterium]